MKTKRALRLAVLFCAYALGFCLCCADGEETYCFVLKWGSQASGDGEFNQPSTVAVDASGNVFIADFKNHRIQKFDRSTGFFNWGVRK